MKRKSVSQFLQEEFSIHGVAESEFLKGIPIDKLDEVKVALQGSRERFWKESEEGGDLDQLHEEWVARDRAIVAKYRKGTLTERTRRVIDRELAIYKKRQERRRKEIPSTPYEAVEWFRKHKEELK